jgi:hypothetical protein
MSHPIVHAANDAAQRQKQHVDQAMPGPTDYAPIQQCLKAVFPRLKSNFRFHCHWHHPRKSQSRRLSSLAYNPIGKSLKFKGF